MIFIAHNFALLQWLVVKDSLKFNVWSFWNLGLETWDI